MDTLSEDAMFPRLVMQQSDSLMRQGFKAMSDSFILVDSDERITQTT